MTGASPNPGPQAPMSACTEEAAVDIRVEQELFMTAPTGVAINWRSSCTTPET